MLFLCLHFQQHHDWLGLSETLRMKWEFSFNFPLLFRRGYSRYYNSKPISTERPVQDNEKVMYKCGLRRNKLKAARARKRFLTHKGVQSDDCLFTQTLSHSDKGLCPATWPNSLYFLKFYISIFLVILTYAPQIALQGEHGPPDRAKCSLCNYITPIQRSLRNSQYTETLVQGKAGLLNQGWIFPPNHSWRNISK